MAVRRKRNIGNQRFYAMEDVLRSAYLVPTKSRTETEGVALYFMSMSVQHIKVYDVDFAKTGRRLADCWYKKLKLLGFFYKKVVIYSNYLIARTKAIHVGSLVSKLRRRTRRGLRSLREWDY
jgi:hypothetical protein